MKGTTLRVLLLLTALHSFQACASSPTPTKKSTSATETNPDEAFYCPWGPMTMHGWQSDGTTRMFAAAQKETTFDAKINRIINDGSNMEMPHLILLVSKMSSPKEEEVVHVGPGWFLKQSKLTLKVGDAIRITGRVMNSDAHTVIAMSIKSDNETVSLRDKLGRPFWAGSGHMIPGSGHMFPGAGPMAPNPRGPNR